MSLPISESIETIRRLLPDLPAAALIAIETDLEAKEQETAADRAATPKQETQTTVILMDPEGKLAGDPNLLALVTVIPTDQDPASIPDRLYKAAYAQNAGGKRKRWNIGKLAEFGDVKRKHLKEQGISIRGGKDPLRVIVVDGKVPV